MEALNWLLLLGLTACAGVAALALAVRLEPERRTHIVLLALLFFWGLTAGPVFALGHLNLLWRSSVASLSLALSAGVCVACARGTRPKAFFGSLGRKLFDCVRLGPEALKLCWNQRSLAFIGVLSAFGVCAFTVWLSYILPADESWDGLYYHQPILGFALQNHGFRLQALPRTLLAQTINGYPKFGESLALWFVLFTDKTWIEVGGSLAALGLLLVTFALARRYCADRAACLGWGAVLVLLPAICSQLRTTMVDIPLWFFMLTAVYFTTKPDFRLRDGVVGLLAAAFVLGTKSTGLVLVPLLVLVACIRSWRVGSRARALAALVPNLLLLVLVAWLTFGRNWLFFQNPFWPVSYRNALLHFEFPGLASLAQVAPDLPLPALARRLYAHPIGGVRDIILRGYGYGVPWVVLPLGGVSFVYCLIVVVRGVVRRERDAIAENLLLVVSVCAAPLFLSPSLSNARYNVSGVVAALLCSAWFGGASARQRLQEGALGGAIVLSLAALVWSDYLWGLNLKLRDLGVLVLHSKKERASMNFSTFQMPASVAKQREAELGPGDLAVFTAELTFIGVLWNDAMSSRVEYLPFTTSGRFSDALAQRKPRWVAVGATGPARKVLDQNPDYEFLGVAAQADKSVVFRRRGH
jgi:Dolichyl-phosphate-mannose-protein mannosyltransferase